MQRQRLNPERLKPRTTVRRADLAAKGKVFSLGQGQQELLCHSGANEQHSLPELLLVPRILREEHILNAAESSWNPGLPASRLGHSHQPVWPLRLSGQ